MFESWRINKLRKKHPEISILVEKVLSAIDDLGASERIYGHIGARLFIEARKNDIIIWKGNYRGFFSSDPKNQYCVGIFENTDKHLRLFLLHRLKFFGNTIPDYQMSAGCHYWQEAQLRDCSGIRIYDFMER